MVESFEEIVELSLLFDFYGEMLGEHKKKIFEDYVLNDLSLAEIAEEEGISRQGVHDVVKRCTKQLKEYELALHLVEKFQNMKEKLTKASELLGIPGKEADASDIAKARTLLAEMLEEL
ncbi:MAG: YlxM family DNA-binding protein [Lachnospiraceae bacterium]|nr:YlxM family DNA-binding protein [Lachnospiraceae bacterium]